MNELKHKKAFTLVELIIVITILVILATIAFVSFQNYTKDSRDANRLTTINNISKGLDIFQIKTGFYPEPESKTSFTGAGDKKLHQGIISDNITNTINLSEIPLDPKEKTNYIYSTYGDGKYYQIASETENITSFLYNTTYAENKSSIVRGNYKFDPSLPSLIVIPNSLTGSSVFDPKVCFVTNGGLNSITSSSGSCLKKEDMSLNTIDNSLVGYWDMESLTADGKLKDLSGNNNHGVGSGGIVIGGTGGKVGNATFFSGSTYFKIENNSTLNFDKFFTMSAIYTYSKAYTGAGNNPIINKPFSGGHIKPYYQYHMGVYSPIYGNSLGKKCGFDSKYGSGITVTGRANFYGIDCFGNKNTYYVTSSFDGNNLNIYINGKIFSSTKLELEKYPIDTYNTPLYIGAYGNLINSGEIFFLQGTIDDIKIYNRALSDEEIAQQARIAGF